MVGYDDVGPWFIIPLNDSNLAYVLTRVTDDVYSVGSVLDGGPTVVPETMVRL